MAKAAEDKDQQHPQEKRDQEIVERLLREESNARNMAELARLRIRYCGFPGAREIQKHLDLVLDQWRMTEDQLFELTRQMHEAGQVYKRDGDSQRQDDWS